MPSGRRATRLSVEGPRRPSARPDPPNRPHMVSGVPMVRGVALRSPGRPIATMRVRSGLEPRYRHLLRPSGREQKRRADGLRSPVRMLGIRAAYHGGPFDTVVRTHSRRADPTLSYERPPGDVRIGWEQVTIEAWSDVAGEGPVSPPSRVGDARHTSRRPRDSSRRGTTHVRGGSVPPPRSLARLPGASSRTARTMLSRG